MTPRSYPELADREWLQALVDAGATNAEIADDVGCSQGAVGRAVLRAVLLLGLGGRRQRERPESQTALLADRKWLVARRKEGLTRAEIADLAGVTVTTVSNWTGRHGLVTPNANAFLADRDWLMLRVDAGDSAAVIAERAGTTPETARKWIARHGLAERWESSKYRPIRAELADREWLLVKLEAGESRAAIAQDLRVTAWHVSRAVQVHGLEHLVEVTVGEKSEALRRYFASESVTSIGRKGATIQRWIRDQGIEPASQRYSDVEKRSVIELLSQGEPASTIAADRGIDPTTVRLWRRQADAARAAGEPWP